MIIQKLIKQGILQAGGTLPKWLSDNTQYLVQMGSVAYGVSSDDSDIDVYGWTIPPKEFIFPYNDRKNILGFGEKPASFDQWQMHHVQTLDGGKEYDFSVYNIVKYFQLVAENNPNMVDSLFVPHRCVLHCTKIGQLVRDKRKKFVHKGSYHKFRGYAFAQMSKIKGKSNSSNPKRAIDIEKNGYDTKFAYHILRLALEAEQLLETGEVNLERDREILKSVRRGEWTLERIKQWFSVKEIALEELYQKSTIPHSPDLEELRELLYQCLEEHYGSLDNLVKRERLPIDGLLSDLESIMGKYR